MRVQCIFFIKRLHLKNDFIKIYNIIFLISIFNNYYSFLALKTKTDSSYDKKNDKGFPYHSSSLLQES